MAAAATAIPIGFVSMGAIVARAETPIIAVPTPVLPVINPAIAPIPAIPATGPATLPIFCDLISLAFIFCSFAVNGTPSF